MLTALRRAAQAALEDVPAARKPALRRSDDPEALLATDLPLIAETSAVEAFAGRMRAEGWRVWQVGDWLLMDAEVPVPEAPMPAMPRGETGCCVSLLSRHPGEAVDRVALRAIVKAADSGAPALERLCKRLHAQWAGALREHRPLPGGLLPYLCRATHMTQGGDTT